jgi:hypothetical protein
MKVYPCSVRVAFQKLLSQSKTSELSLPLLGSWVFRELNIGKDEVFKGTSVKVSRLTSCKFRIHVEVFENVL